MYKDIKYKRFFLHDSNNDIKYSIYCSSYNLQFFNFFYASYTFFIQFLILSMSLRNL